MYSAPFVHIMFCIPGVVLVGLMQWEDY
eukprot:SAG11_NODE_35928_length_264_cov_0.909091_1_plen_27_part_01